ncbi:hypothetical protein [Streptomyces beihaiensis]|uniref:Mu-like prophage FluMu N-terminal domain-containing protein n=1 Tax=Streptomyces beihaiensis TaxID=2984495 RepID=A0ABT3U4H0_9ACTN|nr:hypothetical protein [Streptomyces beihaiensis]MCX3064203.1 hypothetical protein [Streptomyces beihaiensis]
MIKLTVEGIDYEFDDQRMLVSEAREIKTLTGLTVPKLFAGVEEGDGDAIAALVFLAKKRAGEALRFSELDSLNLADVDLEVAPDHDEAVAQAAQDAQHAAGAPAQQVAADPMPPSASGTTPTDGTGDTSLPSPTGSNTTPTTSAV